MRSFQFSPLETWRLPGSWRRTAVLVCGLAVVSDTAVWLALVPATVPLAAFGWANLLLAAMLGVGAIAANRALPTRSIAHVLYDAENPPRSRR